MARAPYTQVRANRKRAEPFLDDILALRARGMSFPAIAKALAHFCDADLSDNQIEYVCRGLETPNPRMARAA